MAFGSEIETAGFGTGRSLAVAPPVRFYDAETNELVAELLDVALPEGDLALATNLVRSVSRYRRAREQSSHVVALAHGPIELEGQIETYRSTRGFVRAGEQADRLEATIQRARRLVFEWGARRREGFLDELVCLFSDEDLVRYRIRFTPIKVAAAKLSAGLPGVAAVDAFRPEIVGREVGGARSLVESLRELNPFRLELLSLVYALENTVGDLYAIARLGTSILQASTDLVARLRRDAERLNLQADALVRRSRAAAQPTDDETLEKIRDWLSQHRATGAARRAARLARDMVAALERRTVGGAVEREHTVRDGETIHSIAFLYFGSAEEWRRIYDANGLRTPLLEPGQRLRIPKR